MINESLHEAGPDIPGCDFIDLNPDDMDTIDNDDRIQKMMGDGRITLIGNKLWYFDDDVSIIELLDYTFGINEKFTSFSDFLKEDIFHSDYDDMTEDLVERMKQFVLEWWKQSSDSQKINVQGDFTIDADGEESTYIYTVKMEKK